jgi:hypothetical protein
MTTCTIISRSSRPSKRSTSGTQVEKNDSASSGEDDDEDAFEILTAENLFSTLLSRVSHARKILRKPFKSYSVYFKGASTDESCQ